MPRVAIPIVGDAYADTIANFAAQETINWIPEKAEREGTRTKSLLRTPNGLSLFGTVGMSGVRGMQTMADVLYVVADTTLYSVDSSGVGTALGTIEGSGRVGMAENGFQLAVVNGPKGWVYNKNTLVFGQITDPDFPGADTVAFLDQYLIFNHPDTQEFFWSDIGDATAYDGLDFGVSESNTDLLLAVLVDHREVWLFSQRSIEVWIDTGAADSPFERVSGASIEHGAASAYSMARLDNSIFWLSEDGVVYRARGYQPVRVSTRPIEQAIAEETISEAFAFGYEKDGHAFFVLTFISGKTWIYDASSGAWHRRKSFELSRWRANAYSFAYGKHLVGDYQSGKVYELRADVYTEGDDPIVSERKTQYLSDNNNYHRMAELELVFNTGQGLTTGQGSDPLVDMAYSDDGGRNYTNFRQASLGKTGEYAKRVRFHGLGRSRQRMFHIRVSDPVRRDLLGAEAIIL